MSTAVLTPYDGNDCPFPFFNNLPETPEIPDEAWYGELGTRYYALRTEANIHS